MMPRFLLIGCLSGETGATGVQHLATLGMGMRFHCRGL